LPVVSGATGTASATGALTHAERAETLSHTDELRARRCRHRLPIHATALHAPMRHAESGQFLRQRLQPVEPEQSRMPGGAAFIGDAAAQYMSERCASLRAAARHTGQSVVLLQRCLDV